MSAMPASVTASCSTRIGDSCVAQVLERQVGGAQSLGRGVVARLERGQQPRRAARADAHRARRESGESEVAQVDDRGPLADAADDQAAIDALDEFGQEGIGARILADDRVLDAGDDARVDEFRDEGGRQEILGLDVDDHAPPERIREQPDRARAAFGRGRKRLRQHHRGGERAVAQHARLVDQLAEIGARGRNDPGAGRGGLGEEIEDRRVLVEADVVEVRVAAVHQRRHAAALEMADQRAVRVRVEREVGAARERRHADDGAREVRAVDASGLHFRSSAAAYRML